MKNKFWFITIIFYYIITTFGYAEQMKVLVFAPHQDDDIIGCGGSIAMHVKNNHDVTIVYMTSGIASKKCTKKYGKEGIKKIRDEEARQAAAVLGVKKLIFLCSDEGFITRTDEQRNKIIESIVQILNDSKPHVVYMPHKYDNQHDHMFTHDLVMQARAKTKNWTVPTVLCYEIWTPLQRVLYTENISEYIGLKMVALEKHKSQLDEMRFDDAIKALNRYRAIMLHQGMYCECFELIGVRQEFMKKYRK